MKRNNETALIIIYFFNEDHLDSQKEKNKNKRNKSFAIIESFTRIDISWLSFLEIEIFCGISKYKEEE